MVVNPPICNDCIHYKSRFPGYCTRTSISRPERCGVERQYRGEWLGRCGKSAKFFEANSKPAVGYHDPRATA